MSDAKIKVIVKRPDEKAGRMTNKEAVNWLINITADIGKAEHRDLWHYEQALSEIREMLESVQPEIIRCKDCKYYREYGYVNGKPKYLPRCGFSQIYVDADDFCNMAEREKE